MKVRNDLYVAEVAVQRTRAVDTRQGSKELEAVPVLVLPAAQPPRQAATARAPVQPGVEWLANTIEDLGLSRGSRLAVGAAGPPEQADTLLTPISSLLTPASSLLTPVSSLLTPVVVGPPPSTPSPVPPAATPLPSGVGGRSIDAGRSPRLAPRHAASPSGVVGEPAGQATRQSSNPSPLHPTSLASPLPTWASVVRGGVAASVGEPVYSRSAPSVSAADFSALYELCMKSGLKALVAFHHAAGRQTVTVTCTLPASTTSAAPAGKRRRRRHTRRGRAAAERDTHMRPQLSSPTATAPACDDPPPRSTPTPPPVAASPPAKRVRRR